jgi:phage tail P2-like protein
MMGCEFKTLLPHPTGVELALEQDAAEKYCRADPAVIRRLYDPMECPAEFLPWLAYALSVDVWNPKWPESTKRAVCANSLQMHLHKGTRGSVFDALAALGIRAEIVEWWQAEPSGEPGTMQITLWVNEVILPDADIILGAELVRDVKEQIDRSKRASIHYTFRLAVEASPVRAGIGMSGQLTTLHRADAAQRGTAATAQPATLAIASTGQMSTLHRADATHNKTAAMAAPAQISTGITGQLATLHRIDAVHNCTQADASPLPLLLGMAAQLTTLHRIEVIL